MIIDLPCFKSPAERPYWDELHALLSAMDTDPERRMSLSEVQRLHYLYERCSADLSRLDTFATDPSLRAFLESLVSRAYSDIHETRAPPQIQLEEGCAGVSARVSAGTWARFSCPGSVTLLGCAFGWFDSPPGSASKKRF